MIKAFKRFLIYVISVAVFLPLNVCAQAPEEMKIRVNNVGAQVSVKIYASEGTCVTVELLYPDATVGDFYTNGRMSDAFAGIDMLTVPESGMALYKYTAEQIGLYTLRAYGNIDSMEYTAENNTPPETQYDKFFADLWSVDINGIYDDNMQGSIWLKKSMIDEAGFEGAAKLVKQMMDKRDTGRKVLFIDPLICNMIVANRDNFAWWDTGVAYLNEYLDNFFNAYYHLGGGLDFIYTDCEQGMSNWSMNTLNNQSLAASAEGFKLVAADNRYRNEIKPILAERGFIFEEDPDKGELYYVAYWVSKSAPAPNYLIWNAVMENRKSKYLNEAIYQPAAKYFPAVKYANYSSSDNLAAYQYGSTHRSYLGGNTVKAGTHSSPVIYGGIKEIFLPDGSGLTLAGTPFSETLLAVNRMRTKTLSTPGEKVMPWIVPMSYNYFDYLKNDPYYYEYFMHIGLCNPELFLIYGPKYYNNDDPADTAANIKSLSDSLTELNLYADRNGAETLIDDLSPWHDSYILSGIYSRGRFLWRITPDMTLLDDINDFCTDTENPTFEIGGTTITFPQGQILANVSSSYGFWVETPQNVYPVINEDGVSDECSGLIKLYDKNGIELKHNADKIDSAALFFNSTSGKDVTFIMAKYTRESLNALNDINAVGKSKPSIGSGRIILGGLNKKEPNELVKFNAWENFDTMIPLTSVISILQDGTISYAE